MKNLKLTLVAGLLSIAATASAQFANTGKSSNVAANTDNYDRITLSYNPQTIIPDYDDADNLGLYGISLGYTKGISISKSYPLFVEVGARLNYSFKTQDMFEDEDLDSDEEEAMDLLFNKHHYTTSYMNIAVPVNLAYKFQVKDNVAITPFVGVTLKGNLLAKVSYDIELTEEGEDYIDDELLEEYEDDVNYFDKKDVGKDYVWNRFQIGWNIGAGVDFNQWYVGFSYGSDFMEIAKKTKTSNWAISLGYNF